MKIISNGITDKLFTHLEFKVINDWRYSNTLPSGYYLKYLYMYMGTTTCLMCGRKSSESSSEDEDAEYTFEMGLCYKCSDNLDGINCDLFADIKDLIEWERPKYEKLLNKHKPRKKDLGKVKRYKVLIPKELAKEINLYLIEQGEKQLKKYRAKLLRAKNRHRMKARRSI